MPALIPYWFTTSDGPRGSQVESSAFFVNQPQWPSWSDAAPPSRCTASVTRRSGDTVSRRIVICSANVRPSGETAQYATVESPTPPAASARWCSTSASDGTPPGHMPS